MKHKPPYVIRVVTYAFKAHDCGHGHSAEDAYGSVAHDMVAEAEWDGRVPKGPREITVEWMEERKRLEARLARWLAWVDTKHPQPITLTPAEPSVADVARESLRRLRDIDACMWEETVGDVVRALTSVLETEPDDPC